jgi:uncharacterized protein (DUF433 family)
MMYDERFTIPLYTLSNAAYYLGMKSSTLNSWMKKDGLLTVLPAETPRGPRLPFIALVEAQLYCVFRKAGLSAQAITSGMSAVRKELGNDLLKKGYLAYDGRDILMNLAESSNEPEWTRARDMQIGIPKIIEKGLRLITWASDDYPQSIQLEAYGHAEVIADPRFAFGQPVIKGTRVRVEDILGMFKAGEGLSTISEEMVIAEPIIEALIRPHVGLAA